MVIRCEPFAARDGTADLGTRFGSSAAYWDFPLLITSSFSTPKVPGDLAGPQAGERAVESRIHHAHEQRASALDDDVNRIRAERLHAWKPPHLKPSIEA